MTDLTWPQALLVYMFLPGLAFIGGYLWCNARRRQRDSQRVARMYGRFR